MPTKIEWCDSTWNPVVGCSPVSEGCEHCWAARLAGTRLKHLPAYQGLTEKVDGEWRWTGEVRFRPEELEKPLHWRKPRRVFVCPHGDLFHWTVAESFLDQLLEVIAACPQHTFLALTKRAQNIEHKLYGLTGDSQCRELGGGDYLPNLWLGVSVENQKRADERIPLLLQIPAAVRFVSIEPMLGSVDLTPYLPHLAPALQRKIDARCVGLDWVILGGESGPRARPMHPDWARGVRDQCQAAGVPFFFKGWGEWELATAKTEGLPVAHALVGPDGSFTVSTDGPLTRHLDGNEWCAAMSRVGKKAAGRLLDGREWNEMPEVKDA